MKNLCSFSNLSVALPTSRLNLQPFCRFTYVTAHSPTLLSLYLRHNSFFNPSVALPTSQLILKSFRCFTYVTVHSPNPSFASPTSQALHLRGAMGGISVILVKSHSFILLNKFNLNTIIYDSLKFQTSITLCSHLSVYM